MQCSSELEPEPELGFPERSGPCAHNSLSVLASLLGVLLVGDVARQVKPRRYLPTEVACRGILSEHTALLHSQLMFIQKQGVNDNVITEAKQELTFCRPTPWTGAHSW